MNDKTVYIVVSETYPDNHYYISMICSTEEKAWNFIEDKYYYHLDFLQRFGFSIKEVWFDNKTIENAKTIYIRYTGHKVTSGTVFHLIKRVIDDDSLNVE